MLALLGTAGAESIPDMAERAGAQHGLPRGLLSALVLVESSNNPDARSAAGAIGLAQLMPGTARDLRVDPRDPWQNVWGGGKYLAQQLRTFNGNIALALAAYNAGAGNVIRYGGIPPFTETVNYVKRVLNAYQSLSATPPVRSATAISPVVPTGTLPISPAPLRTLTLLSPSILEAQPSPSTTALNPAPPSGAPVRSADPGGKLTLTRPGP